VEAAAVRRSVLVVDDDAAVATLVAAVLRRDGIAVETAADALQALERLGASRFDAVLTDITMPGMSGLQLVREAERRGHRTPFLVMTAFLDARSERALCDDPAVTGILRKPFDIQRLLRDVRALLERTAPVSAPVSAPATPEPCWALAPLWLVRPAAPQAPPRRWTRPAPGTAAARARPKTASEDGASAEG
jgi:DNA-binding response OmpR family regulator